MWLGGSILVFLATLHTVSMLQKRYFLGKNAHYTSSKQVPLFYVRVYYVLQVHEILSKNSFLCKKGEMWNFFGTSQNLLLALCGCQGNHSLRLYCKGFQKVELCKRSGGGEQILLYKSLSINNEIGEEPTEMSNT